MRLTFVFLLLFVALANGDIIGNFLKKVAVRQARTDIPCNMQDSANKILETKCNQLISTGENAKFRMQDVTESKWMDFAGRLYYIENVDVTIDGSNIQKLDMPGLTKFNNPKATFNVTNNLKLNTVGLSCDKIVANQLIINGNPLLTKIKINAPTQFMGSLTVTKNAQLYTLELLTKEMKSDWMPTAGSAIPEVGLIISENPKLTEFQYSQVEEFHVPKIKIHFAHGLVGLNFTETGKIYTKHMEISDNDNLAVFYVKPDRKEFVVDSLVVRGNLKLKTFFIHENDMKKVALNLHGNPLLEESFLADQKRKYPLMDIQEFGECKFGEDKVNWREISDLSQLKACRYVQGDLHLAKSLTGSTDGYVIPNIYGNVYLLEHLPSELQFFDGTKVDQGYFYSTLCNFKEVFGESRMLFGHYVVDISRGPCQSTSPQPGTTKITAKPVTATKPTTTPATVPTAKPTPGGKPTVKPPPPTSGEPEPMTTPKNKTTTLAPGTSTTTKDGEDNGQGSVTEAYSGEGAAGKKEGGSSKTIFIIVIIVVVAGIVGGGVIWFVIAQKKRVKGSEDSESRASSRASSRLASSASSGRQTTVTTSTKGRGMTPGKKGRH